MLVPVAANAKVLLDVRADETQSSRMFSGTEAVTSVMERSVVGIMEDREPTQKRASLVVLTRDVGEVTYHIGPENISVSAHGETLVVINYDPLMRETGNQAKCTTTEESR